tara:strand:+ start:22650 stop:23198 length:549 start_codon:yes stop_codon:yes gene_type:complete
MLKNTLHARVLAALNKRSHFLVACIVTSVLISCQDVKRPQAPSNLIPQDAMVSILVDTYLMNAARSIDNRTIVSQGILLDSIIYTTYRIDSLQFAQSNAFYTADLELYKKIFLQVEEKLKIEKTKKDTMYAQYKRVQEVKRLQDSVREILLDSMQKILPKIKRDSLSRILNKANVKKQTTEN